VAINSDSSATNINYLSTAESSISESTAVYNPKSQYQTNSNINNINKTLDYNSSQADLESSSKKNPNKNLIDSIKEKSNDFVYKSNDDKDFYIETNSIKANSGTSASQLFGNNSIQYYLIAYGQTKPRVDELSQFKFISKHDQDGKYIYVEPK
jgi:hypothetical protein